MGSASGGGACNGRHARKHAGRGDGKQWIFLLSKQCTTAREELVQYVKETQLPLTELASGFVELNYFPPFFCLHGSVGGCPPCFCEL